MQKEIKKRFKSAVFIFRRDLRLDDNTGLLEALKLAEKVFPVFIFDPRQIDKSKNSYFSNKCVQFMCESLEDLDSQLEKKGSKLNWLYGEYPYIIEDLLKATKADLLHVNCDYTNFSKIRDEEIKKVCDENKVTFSSFEDICLLTKKKALDNRDEFWKKFTPFYNAVNSY